MTLEEDMAMGIEKVEKEEDHAMAMKVVNASTIREILTYPLLTSPLKMALKLLEFVSMTYLWWICNEMICAGIPLAVMDGTKLILWI